MPPKYHKTGKRTGKPKIIKLVAAAQAIIAKQPQVSNYVFVPAKGQGPISLAAAWRKVRREANLPDNIGMHGLRHSVGSHMAMAGAQAPEIMTALGQRQLSTVQRHIHFAENARQIVAEKAAAPALAGMAAASKPKSVQMKGGRS